MTRSNTGKGRGLRIACLGLLCGFPSLAQISFSPPGGAVLSVQADTPITRGAWRTAHKSIGGQLGTGGRIVQFVRTQPIGQDKDIDWLLVSPSTAVVGMDVTFAPNPEIVPYLPSGIYERDVFFAPADDPTATFWTTITLRLISPGPPEITSVTGAASYQSRISPGQLVTILGSHLSTPPLKGKFTSAGTYPTELGNTFVTFNGIRAPITYVSNNQVNCLVPQALAGQKSVDVVVSRTNGATSPAFTIPLQDTAPEIFTADQSGSGQAAVLNVDPANPTVTTANGTDNPVPKGWAITFFATGAGLWPVRFYQTALKTPYPDGSVVFDLGLTPVAPVSLTIGGKPAKVFYAAAVYADVLGMLQINAMVPDDTPSGLQPMVLKIGDYDNSAQPVTLAVQ